MSLFLLYHIFLKILTCLEVPIFAIKLEAEQRPSYRLINLVLPVHCGEEITPNLVLKGSKRRQVGYKCRLYLVIYDQGEIMEHLILRTLFFIVTLLYQMLRCLQKNNGQRMDLLQKVFSTDETIVCTSNTISNVQDDNNQKRPTTSDTNRDIQRSFLLFGYN